MKAVFTIVAALTVGFVLGTVATAHDSAQEREISAFNQTFTESIRQMDNAAVLNLWAEDGVSLLPNAQAIEGKPAIAKFMQDVTGKLTGYKVLSQEDDFRGLEVSGDWASEWALTRQVVQPPQGNSPLTVNGKMLLVLHRYKDGWKIERESWTPRPTT